MNDLISVIVPVYKVEKYLKQCIESIINQTYRNLEIILVDDGSPDNCGEICDEYAKIDKRIKVIHKNNGGLSDARNAGLEIATGELIGFVDSDDYIAKDMYEVLYKNMIENDSDIAIGDIVYVDEDGGVLSKINKFSPIKNECLSSIQAQQKLVEEDNHYYVVACTKLYSRKLFVDLQFEKGKIHEDEFIIHHIFDKAEKISTKKNGVYYYRQRTTSIMTSTYGIARLDALEALMDRITFYRDNKQIELLKKTEKKWVDIVLQAYNSLNPKEKAFVERFCILIKVKNEVKREIIENDEISPYNIHCFNKIYDVAKQYGNYTEAELISILQKNKINRAMQSFCNGIWYCRNNGLNRTLKKVKRKIIKKMT